MTDKLTPTSGRAWRQAREEGYLITLPSGNSARLRPVALDVMIESGKLPDLLTPLAAKTLWTESETDDIANDAELVTGITELAVWVCRAAFVEPRIVDEPSEEDEIGIEDVSFVDKMAVFQLSIQPSEVLRRFRDQQARGVEPVPDGENDTDETE